MNELQRHTILNFFTIYLGQNNPALNHSRYWVEAFGPYFGQIRAFATHTEFGFQFGSENISLSQIGGGSFPRRVLAIFKLIGITFKIIMSRQRNICFFHMTTRFLPIVGPILKFFQVPIFLWYSHQSSPISLKLSLRWVDVVISPTKNTFPARAKKMITTGHGLVPAQSKIEFNNQESEAYASIDGELKSILVIGRVARVKRIENLFIALANGDISNCIVECIGPLQDQTYFAFLLNLAKELNLEVTHIPALNASELSDYTSKKTFVFSGTQGSVDKAPLEAVANGCLLISTNEDLLNLSGMNDFWLEEFNLQGNEIPLEKQIKLLTNSKIGSAPRMTLTSRCRERNRLQSLSRRISSEMLNYL